MTYLGAVYGTLSALKRMRLRSRGTIVQVGSALTYRSIPLQSAYCAAKHAVAGFTDSLRCELIHQHSRIHVTMVQMPALNTPQFSWVKSRLQRRPQPVPPIFNPKWPRERFIGLRIIAGMKLALGRSAPLDPDNCNLRSDGRILCSRSEAEPILA
jgi:NAD(P)-dependent dehydrogenase (short-subunit alcohol dehydrogenase family)